DQAEGALRGALEHRGLEYDIHEGDGAFYGPKIDLHTTDSIGRSWQLGTVQLDYAMPERFGMTYAGADNAEHRPVMIHRALFGSFERFIGILIEHYAGEFPPWLAPVQAIVLPVADRFNDYGAEVVRRLRAEGARVELDDRSESVKRKIRDAELRKVPYMLIVGGGAPDRRRGQSGRRDEDLRCPRLRPGPRTRPGRGRSRGAPARGPRARLLQVQVRAGPEAEAGAQAPAADHRARDQVPAKDRPA